MGRNKTIEDDEVLAVAREIFRKEGHAASTRDIARAAGISQAVLYQRFGSKDELFFRAMTPSRPDLETLLGPYPPKDARADLLALAHRLFAYLRAFTPTLLQVVAHPGADADRLKAWHAELPIFPIADAVADRFQRLAADGFIRPGDARASALALISAIHALAFFENFTTRRERVHLQANVEALVTVLWCGLEPRAAVR